MVLKFNDEIDIEKAREEFKKYVSAYDFSNKKISHKYSHSIRVAQLSRQIATYVKNFVDSSVNVDLAELIGLLHDIGRFEQAKVYNSFNDRDTVDHALLGIQILRQNDFLKVFCPNERFYDSILTAIYYHNKFAIGQGYEGPNMMQTRILRDSDKLDIIRTITTRDFESLCGKADIRGDDISDSIFNQFMSCQECVKTDCESSMDDVICMISFIFDINYPITLEVIKEEGYVDKILDRVDSAHNHSKIIDIRNMANIFMNNQTNRWKV